jgi:hypothetical protein
MSMPLGDAEPTPPPLAIDSSSLPTPPLSRANGFFDGDIEARRLLSSGEGEADEDDGEEGAEEDADDMAARVVEAVEDSDDGEEGADEGEEEGDNGGVVGLNEGEKLGEEGAEEEEGDTLSRRARLAVPDARSESRRTCSRGRDGDNCCEDRDCCCWCWCWV